jgi:hypothetical protein
MAVKNMQSVVTCAAKTIGVSATGTEQRGSKRTFGERPAHFVSLPWRPLPGLMPTRTEPDANSAQAERTGRSASKAVVNAPARFARSASRAVLSGRLAYMPLQGITYCVDA